MFGVVLKTKFEGGSYVLYFLAGMLPWLAFSEAVGRAPYVMLEHRSFVKKLVFPLETLPVNLVISGAVTEAFGLAIFTLGLLSARHALPSSVLWLPAADRPAASVHCRDCAGSWPRWAYFCAIWGRLSASF